MKLRSVEEWQAESLRLTLFLGIGEQVREQKWWSELLGTEAAAVNIRREIGQRQEIGAYDDDRQLVLSIGQDRVDWRLTPPSTAGELGRVPNVGQYPSAAEDFSKLMLDWFKLDSCPSASRLAFGAILITPVEDVQAGYRQISEYTSLNINTQNASDFLYQINRARDAKSVSGVKINRLSKWSVSSMRWVSGRFYKGMVTAIPFTGTQALNCRLELDINTVPEPGLELVRDDLPNLYKEFVELGKEIVQNGDVV